MVALHPNSGAGEYFIYMPASKPTFVCLLFYVLGTSKVISGWVPTCDRSYQDGYRLVTVYPHGDIIVLPPLGNQAISTMT